MSRSYDRSSGRGRPPREPYGYETRSGSEAEAYNDVTGEPTTGRPAGASGYGEEHHVRGEATYPPFETSRSQQGTVPPPPAPPPTLGVPDNNGLVAPARAKKGARDHPQRASIVPAGSVTGRSLTLVITIMCFLACLTAGAVYLINQSASAWLRDVASEVTVQVEPRERVDTEKTMADVVVFLGGQPGVRSAKPLSLERSTDLLEPWLGQSDVLKSLPVPRLIALELDRAAPPDFERLRTALTTQFQGVSLDDHRQWQQQIRTVTRSFALGGLAILALVAAATTAIIVSATRSAMASNRDIVEVLHFVGATDRFISSQFERHFLVLGVRAGFVGAFLAGLIFALMPALMELLGGGTVTMTELQRLVGVGSLDLPGFMILGLVVIVIAALCMVTSRMSVFRILNSQH